jgi:hypothetical protein
VTFAMTEILHAYKRDTHDRLTVRTGTGLRRVMVESASRREVDNERRHSGTT